jgi:hypothetical protein
LGGDGGGVSFGTHSVVTALDGEPNEPIFSACS